MELNGDTKDSSNLLTAKIYELEKIKEELKQSKEAATQSWLDSRPLIDSLEKMQAELASANARSSKANATISELQGQLRTEDQCIKFTKEEEQKFRTMINDKNQALHTAQEEMERLKMKIDQKRRRRSKLKLVLRLKRQTIQTLQLTLEAIHLETEAFSTSESQALRYINNADTADSVVHLTQEEYDYLKKEASEQAAMAEWRISVSEEEKLAAENNRHSALRRLRSFNNKETIMKINAGRVGSYEEITKNGNVTKDQVKSITSGVNKKNSRQQSLNNSNLVKKKKSIFFRIKTFIVRNITKYFK